ncbi:hypothetical protein D9M73_158990 [compost metagenome]
MMDALHPFAVRGDIIVLPQRFEFRADPTQLRHQLGDGGAVIGPCARYVGAKGTDNKAGDTVPIRIAGADVVAVEHQAKDVALLARQLGIVGEHQSSAAVPPNDIPHRGLDDRGTEHHPVQHPLEPRRDAVDRLVARFRRAAEAEHVEMLALRFGQQEPLGDSVEHIGRRRAPAPLLEPCVPGRADIRPAGHLFAAQPRRAPSPAAESQCHRVEACAAIPKIRSEQRGRVACHAQSC